MHGLANHLFPDFGKNLKKSIDNYSIETAQSGTIDEIIIISQEEKSEETIREEFLEKRFWFKRILNWQNIRKNPISIVKRR